MIQLLFSISLFLSASLLFAIQPMVAKIMLPVYGGTPAVWTVCMLFFQSLLLCAYGYAWLLSRFANPWLWRLLHILLILLSLTVFPLEFVPSFSGGSPDLSLLKLLVSQLGLPLFVVGASAPLLQFAYSQTQAKQANDPYFLYAASNVGSLLALMSYPWVIERYIGLSKQFHYWNLAFVLYLVLLGLVLFAIPYRQGLKTKLESYHLSWVTMLRWVGYSFIPCSLMLGVTFYISTDIAATPLFWVLPLAIYLLSFVITFAKKPIISHEWVKRNILFFIIFPLLGFIIGANFLSAWQLIIFHLASFFMLALLCHGELVQIRPPASRLTSFYFCLALGGVLAGLFNGLIAPRLFVGAYEYPLILTFAMLCISLPKFRGLGFMPFVILALLLVNYFLPNQPWLTWFKEKHLIEILALSLILFWPRSRINLFTCMAILFVFLFSPWFKQVETLEQQRNFYGVKQVLATVGAHALVSQNTLHGFQLQNELKFNGALAYYSPVLPVVQRLQKAYPTIHSTILGLGTGMLACQFRANDRLKMIDIDGQVIDIAKNVDYFTYLRDCPPSTSLVEGDGRLVLGSEPDAELELLIVDAFSSDAIPMHLLTLEAFKLYQQKISPDGLILANISNRHLHLLPVLTAAGRELQLLVLTKLQGENYKAGQFPSEWVLLTANEPLAIDLMQKEGWRFVAEADKRLWTDDYTNLVSLMKW